MEFYKAKWFSIRLMKRPSSWIYVRLANASELMFLWFDISWRRSWLPQAAYAMGWDAAWRQFYLVDGESREKVIQEIRNEQTRDAQLQNGADDAGHDCPLCNGTGYKRISPTILAECKHDGPGQS